MVTSGEDARVRELMVPVSDDGGAALRTAIVDAAAWTAADGSRTARILLAPGVHRIEAGTPIGDDAAIVIADAARIEIHGAGAELLFADPHHGGIDLRGCREVTLRGFTVDYLSPSFTQGRIVDVDVPRGTFRYRPADGYPDFTDRDLFVGSGYGTLRDAIDGVLKPASRQTFMVSYAAEPDADGAFLVTVEPDNRAWMSHIEEGDGFVVGHRGDRHGIRLDGCDRITVRDVTIHAAPCAAILAHESSSMLLERVTVARRPGSSRWISTNADAVHCQGGRSGPQIVGCRFEGMHDDGVNLYVYASRLAEVRGHRTVVLDGGAAVLPGDVLQFVDGATGSVLLESAVQEASDTGLLLADGLPETIAVGIDVYNRSNALPGFRIDACRFHDFRGIGIRLKASRGVIADCRFERLSGCGLWIANDPGWSEGPLGVRDVSLLGNRFLASPGDVSLQSWPHSAATVMIEVFSADDGPAVSRAHDRITLRDTEIEQTARTAVFVGGARAVDIEDMRVRERAGASWLATRDGDVRVAEVTGSAE